MHNLLIGCFMVIMSCGYEGQTKDLNAKDLDIRDTAVYNKLKSLNFNEYIDKKTVGEFLADVGADYIRYTYGTARTVNLRLIYFVYSEKLWVEIQVNEFKHLESFNKEQKWDVEKFKMEKVGALRFKYGGNCVKCVEKR